MQLPGLHVTVDQILYQPEAPAPPDRPHCFVYFISIRNDSGVTVTIKRRKWIVRNAEGETTVVEADGVVGEFPMIAPGEKFCYNSFHLLETPTGTAEGSYLGIDSEGRQVVVRIPRFQMGPPG